MPTVRTAFGGGIKPARHQDPAAAPGRFVLQLPAELGHAHVGDRLGQMVVLQHPAHLQVFQHDGRLGSRQPAGDLVQGVAADIRHPGVLPCQPVYGLPAVGAAFFPSGDRPLQSLQSGQGALQRPRIFEAGPIADLRQGVYPQVHPYRRLLDWLGVFDLLLHLQGDEPAPAPLAHRGAQDVDAVQREIAAFLQPQPPQSRQLDGFLEDMDRSREPEAADALLPGLVPGETHLDLLARLLLLHPSEEIRKGSVQIAQGLLRGTLGDFVHPGQLCFLQGIQLAVQVYGGWDFLPRLVGGDLPLQSPIEGIPPRTRMTQAGCPLDIVQVQLRLVAALDLHSCSAASRKASTSLRFL